MPEIAKLWATVGADVSDAERGFESISGKIAGFAKTAGLALAGAAAAIGAAGVVAVNSAAGFEQTMSGVKAVSGATADQMGKLSGLALQLGKDTSFSASEAASGIEELVKGGLSIQDVLGGAASATLNLAAAGGVDLPAAATIAANAMAQFSLKGSDMAHVADLIAGAANASAIDVSQFQFSLAAAGAVASTVGFHFDDLATAIAVMGNAGIVGSDAGTSLKTMMLNLTPSTKQATDEMRALGIITADGANKFFDATGKVKSMADVAQVLHDATATLTEQQRLQALQTIFGTDAIRAAAVIAREGAAGFREMAGEMGKVTAASVAGERLNNLRGDIEQLKGSLDTLAITAGTALLPALRGGTQAATEFVNGLIPWVERVGPQVVSVLQQASAAALGVVDAFRAGGLAGAFAAVVPLVQNLSGALLGWVATVGPPLVAQLTSLAGVVIGWALDMAPRLAATVLAWGQSLVGWVAAALPGAVSALAGFAQQLAAVVVGNATMFGNALLSWGAQLAGWVVPALPGVLATLGGYADTIIRWAAAQLPRLATALVSWTETFAGWIAGAANGAPSGILDLAGVVANSVVQTAGILGSALLRWGLALVEWVAPQVPGILAALGTVLVQVGAWVVAQAPTVLATLDAWGAALVGWVAPRVPPLLEALGGLIGRVWTWIVDTAPTLPSRLLAWGAAFVDWVGPKVTPMLEALGRLIGRVWDWIRDQAPSLPERLLSWGQAFVDWIDPKIEPMLAAARGLSARLGTWITDEAAPAILGKLSAWGAQFSAWIGPAADQFVDKDWPATLTRFLDWIEQDAAPAIYRTLSSWVSAFVRWVGGDNEEGTAAGGLFKTIGNINSVLWRFIEGTASVLGPRLLTWAGAFLGWVGTSVVPFLATELGKMLVEIGNWLTSTAVPWAFEQFKSLGAAIVRGIVAGIVGLPNAIADAVHQLTTFSPAPVVVPVQPDFGPGNRWQPPVQGAIPGGVTVVPPTIGFVNGAPIRDSGGSGMAGQPYYIGTGAQPEMFVPNQPGTFFPAGSYGARGPIQVTVPVRVGATEIARAVATINTDNAERGIR